MLFKNNPVPEKLQLRNKDGVTPMDMLAANDLMDLARALTEDLCENVQYSDTVDSFYQDNSLMSAREQVSASSCVCLFHLIATVLYVCALHPSRFTR